MSLSSALTPGPSRAPGDHRPPGIIALASNNVATSCTRVTKVNGNGAGEGKDTQGDLTHHGVTLGGFQQ